MKAEKKSQQRPLAKLMRTGGRLREAEPFVLPPHAIRDLQLKMLRIQQGVWHSKKRVMIVFEGFDAAGKGGAIKKLTETLDPRSFRVHPIGPPSPEE